MNNDTAALLATATAKSAALAGLADALEYGPTRALRVNGTMTIFAGDFRLTIDSAGTVRCRGYVVNSTCRDLAYGIVRDRY